MAGLDKHCASVPVVARESDLISPAVHVQESSSPLHEAVFNFLRDVNEAPAGGDADLDASDLFLPHPRNAPLYTRMLATRASTSLMSRSPAELQSEFDAATSQLQAKYQAARAHLTCLEGKRGTELLASNKGTAVDLECPLPLLSSSDAIHARVSTLQTKYRDPATPTIVQFAVHNPNAGFHVTQVILLHAQQTLADLQAAISCVADRNADAWAATHPGAPTARGSLFYLDQTLFYDAHTGCENYAAPVAAFLKQQATDAFHGVQDFMHQRGLQYDTRPEFLEAKMVPMHTATIGSLNLEVGHPGYMYAHAGVCEHMITVQDVRLQHSDDPPALISYPATIFRRAPVVQRCCICVKRPASLVVHNDDLAPCTPAYFCSNCFEALHHDESGALVPSACGMECFPYFHE